MVSLKLKRWRTAGAAVAVVTLGACAHSDGYYHGGYGGERGES